MYHYDFRAMTISKEHALRLSMFQSAALKNKNAGDRTKLWRWLHDNEYNLEKGLYIPLAKTVTQTNRVRDEYGKVSNPPADGLRDPFSYLFFGNPLLFPIDVAEDADPIYRLTNSGSIFATLEFDPETAGQFDEIGGWFGGNRDDRTAFHQVHKALKRFADYRGYCIVFSGRRSYQAHFRFDATHLVNAPYDENIEARLCDYEAKAILMAKAHEIAWTAIKEIFIEQLNPPIPTDNAMKSALQWRRTPFGLRRIESGKEIFGLREGDAVLQLVVRESMTERAYPGSGQYLIDPNICLSQPYARPQKPAGSRQNSCDLPNKQKIIEAIRDDLVNEWGEFPRLVNIGKDAEDYVFYFQNDKDDKTPSSIIKGSYKKLLVRSHNSSNDNQLFLPADFSANELVRYYSTLFGLKPIEIPFGQDNSKQELINAARGNHRALIEQDINDLFDIFSGNCVYLLDGLPGLGKSSLVLDLLKDRFEERYPWEDTKPHIILFGSVSTEQAEKKLQDYRGFSNGQGVMWESFWTIYKRLCKEKGKSSIKAKMPNLSPGTVWQAIAIQQPEIAKVLLAHKEAMWRDINLNQLIVVFTSIATLETYPFGRVSKALWHPAFDPELNMHEIDDLADGYDVELCILDDYRTENLLSQHNEGEIRVIETIQRLVPKWKKMKPLEKQKLYKAIPDGLKQKDFDGFDALANIELETLATVTVDFEAIPYGSVTDPESIYRKEHGKKAVFGAKEWLRELKCRKIFLTTENVVAAVTEYVFRNGVHPARIIRRSLEPTSGVHPIQVPIIRDERAVSRDVEALVDEIVSGNENAIVICNGVDNDNAGTVINFELAKGRNDLSDNDIYIIMTMLHPKDFARLNALGIFIARPDIIKTHYRDLLIQATGRNTGYRDTRNGRRTIVIQGRKLQRMGYFENDSTDSADPSLIREFVTYPLREKPWLKRSSEEDSSDFDVKGNLAAISIPANGTFANSSVQIIDQDGG